MTQKLWFKNKKYGWGWQPATWEGWLSLLVYIALITWNTTYFTAHQNSVEDFLINTICLTAILIWLCYKKGEKPGWHWGN